MERERFKVLVTDENERVTEHSVAIHHQDMLRGELELARSGVPDAAKLNLVTAWCWAALTREGHYSKSYAQFRDMECMGLEDDGQETVDPTQPETPEGSG